MVWEKKEGVRGGKTGERELGKTALRLIAGKKTLRGAFLKRVLALGGSCRWERNCSRSTIKTANVWGKSRHFVLERGERNGGTTVQSKAQIKGVKGEKGDIRWGAGGTWALIKRKNQPNPPQKKKPPNKPPHPTTPPKKTKKKKKPTQPTTPPNQQKTKTNTTTQHCSGNVERK